MPKYRLRNYIGGSSSPGGYQPVSVSKRFLNVTTTLSTEDVEGQRLPFLAAFVRPLNTTQYNEEVDRFSNQAVSLSGASGSRSLSLSLSSGISYGHLENGRSAYVTPSFPSQAGGSITATNVRVSGLTVSCTLQWSGINPIYGNGSVNFGATYDWLYSVTTDTVPTNSVAYDIVTSNYSDHFYNIDLDGQTITQGNYRYTYSVVHTQNAGGTSGVGGSCRCTYYGDTGDLPFTQTPPSCVALCQRQAYTYSGIYNTSHVPDPTTNVSSGRFEGGITQVDVEYIGNYQIRYTAYSSYGGGGISGGSFYIFYGYETWRPGYTNYYWKIKVNGTAVTSRYLKINGTVYDCYNGSNI